MYIHTLYCVQLQVYLRGSHIKFIILPDLLKNAPVFKGVQKMATSAAAAQAAKGRGSGGKKKVKKTAGIPRV
jgi:small nuclear ribonucleoprotein D3